MAEKQIANIDISEIKKILKSKEVVMGTKEVVKRIKLGKANKVYLTSNCPSDVKKDIEYYAELGKTEVFSIDCTNEELGVLFKRAHPVSVIALSKGGN